DLIDEIHRARGRAAAIIFNPGAFTHYAHALADALAAYDGVVVEVHLSNPAAREAWRRTSVIAPVATGTIAGFGGTGYRLPAAARGYGRVGLEAHGVTWSQQRSFASEWFPGAELVPTENLIEGLRRVKDAGEVARIRAACSIADAAFANVAPRLRDRPTEVAF